MRGDAVSVAAAWLWARRELRARLRSLVVLGVLAGLAGGLVVAAVAGARRTSTAFDRWRDATDAPDAIVFGTQVGQFDLPYERVLRLPEVVDGGQFSLSPMEVAGTDIGSLPPADAHLYRTLSRPLLTAGRLPDPRRADEIMVNRAAARRLHLEVGDRLTVVTGNDLNAFWGGAETKGGPRLRVTVVGIGDSAMDFAFMGDEPAFVPSAALLVHYGQRVTPDDSTAAPGHIPLFTNLLVRLRPGTDVAAFHQRAAAALGQPDIPVRDLAEDRKRFVHATDLEQTGLLVFAGTVALAGLVLIGQALARTVYAVAEPAPTLRAIGFTRGTVVGAVLLATAPVVAVAAVGVGASAYVLSSRFPIGLAGRLDPGRGYHVDVAVFAAGVVLVVAAVLAGITLFAVRATRSSRAAGAARPSAVARFVRTRAPLPVGIGAGLALESGTGTGQVPVRPAIAGAIAGVVGVLAAFGLLHGIDDAVASPSRAGQVWDATVYGASDDVTPAQILRAAERDPEIGDISRGRRVPTDVSGVGVPVYLLDHVRGGIDFVVLHGRRPVDNDEVALGPATAKALHKGIGDRVTIGAEHARSFRVVGIALLPETSHSSFDQGAWMPSRAAAGVLPPPIAGNDEAGVFVRWRAGVDAERAMANLGRHGLTGDPVGQPGDVLLLRNVRALPRALAAFLVLLALAAVAHVLATVVRRRRNDFAVLRALGFRRRQVAASIHWLAMTIGVVALVIGVPLGVSAARTSWRWIADRTPLVYARPVPALAVLVIAPAAVVLVNVLAGLPARRAARLRAVDALRAE